jgi:ribonuclease HI
LFGNPGPGGYGIVFQQNHLSCECSGSSAETTNNRMELIAVIKAIEPFPIDAHLVINSDSEYVLKGITDWIKKWKLKGWTTSTKKPVLNRDL